MGDAIDAIVRIHTMNRMPELQRCVFSLCCQSYRPLNIVVVTQRFSADDLQEVETQLSPMVDGDKGLALHVVNFDGAGPEDARAALIAEGIAKGTGRYFALLDYDDVLYPEAYELLVNQMAKTGAGIAFASVRFLHMDVYPSFLYPFEDLDAPYHGQGLLDLFRNNFCPPPSYAMDRRQIPVHALSLDTELCVEEDYDLLLRICAATKSDFSLLSTVIGDYVRKTDGSNTVAADSLPDGINYADVRTEIELRRRVTRLSPMVQKDLGLSSPDPDMTIRAALDRFGV